MRRDSTGGDDNSGIDFDVSVPMVLRDPRKYCGTQQAISIDGWTSAPVTLMYRGDYPSWPILTWSMSAVGTATEHIVISGGTVSINLSSVSTGSFTLNYQNRTLVDANGTSRADLFIGAPDFREVQAGSTAMLYDSAGIVNRAITCSYYEAWP